MSNKGLCSYYAIDDARLTVWSYPHAYAEVSRIIHFVSFEPDIVSIELDDTLPHLEPEHSVLSHGPDSDFSVAQTASRGP